MSAEITVVFHIDLICFNPEKYDVSHEASQAIGELQNRVEIAGLNIAGIYRGIAQNIVLSLPKDEKILGDILYFCNRGSLPYKTLWLNDSVQWHEDHKS